MSDVEQSVVGDPDIWFVLANELSDALNDLCNSVDAGKSSRTSMERIRELWQRDLEDYGGLAVKDRYLLTHWLWMSVDKRLHRFELEGSVYGNDIGDFRFVMNGPQILCSLNGCTIGLLSNLYNIRKRAMLLLSKKETNVYHWLDGLQLGNSNRRPRFNKPERLSLPEEENNGFNTDVGLKDQNLGAFAPGKGLPLYDNGTPASDLNPSGSGSRAETLVGSKDPSSQAQPTSNNGTELNPSPAPAENGNKDVWEEISAAWNA